MTDKRRIFLIIVSVLGGTVLASLLMLGRKGKLEAGDLATLFVNLLLALAIIVGIGVIFRKKKK